MIIIALTLSRIFHEPFLHINQSLIKYRTMSTTISILTVLFLTSCVVCGEEESKNDAFEDDSYLEAYKNVHGESVHKLVNARLTNIDRDYQVNPNVGYPYPAPQPQYGPPVVPNYGPPAPQYGPPIQPVYGPPAPPPAYGPPAPPPPPAYGPPAPPVYGPPAPPVYGPPSSVQVFYGVPHALGSIWDKLKLKLTLFTLGKILLKLVIFKKIVSWIAVLCLLLFIPSLKNKEETSSGSNDEARAWGRLSEKDMDNMTALVMRALNAPSFEAEKGSSEH
ncbi:hypothetical protein JTB14_009108 [Gonioctena quinquepunctata]|nr:hypothetical protein JTB14_009108 [Gonioctena quinquepunctata]